MAAIAARAASVPAPSLPPPWLAACQAAWQSGLAAYGSASETQQAVAAMLGRVGLAKGDVQLQERTPDGNVTVDIAVSGIWRDVGWPFGARGRSSLCHRQVQACLCTLAD